MPLLLAWLGIMALAAAGATWLLARVFPSAFTLRDGRRISPWLLAGLVLAGMVGLSGLTVLLLMLFLLA